MPFLSSGNSFTEGRGFLPLTNLKQGAGATLIADLNNDGKNDCFRVFGIAPECEEAEIRIFNRWGERVYYSKDLTDCWNGKVDNSGSELPSGTYFYQLDVLKSPFVPTPKHLAGSINLIR